MSRPTLLEKFRIYTALRRIYDSLVRPHLPKKVGVYNGVPVRDRGLLDVTDVQENYEGALVESIRSTVETGDDCVVVGGGRGVSGVIAANAAGPDADVTIYEGSQNQVELVSDTVELAQVSKWTTVKHAVVSEAVDIYGETGTADRIQPQEIVDCEALILDCEGAELNIIEALSQHPEKIIVETHGVFDSPESEVRDALNSQDYNVVDKKTEYEDRGIHVLTAFSDA